MHSPIAAAARGTQRGAALDPAGASGGRTTDARRLVPSLGDCGTVAGARPAVTGAGAGAAGAGRALNAIPPPAAAAGGRRDPARSSVARWNAAGTVVDLRGTRGTPRSPADASTADETGRALNGRSAAIASTSRCSEDTGAGDQLDRPAVRKLNGRGSVSRDAGGSGGGATDDAAAAAAAGAPTAAGADGAGGGTAATEAALARFGGPAAGAPCASRFRPPRAASGISCGTVSAFVDRTVATVCGAALTRSYSSAARAFPARAAAASAATAASSRDVADMSGTPLRYRACAANLGLSGVVSRGLAAGLGAAAALTPSAMAAARAVCARVTDR